MPIEEPREVDRDIERLDTDYDPPPTIRRNTAVAKKEDRNKDRTDPKTGETVSKRDVKKDERMIEELKRIAKEGKDPEAQR